MKKEIKKYMEIAAVFAAAFLLVYLIIHNLAFLAGFLATGMQAVKPFLLGCVMAYVINILMNIYETWYFPKSNQEKVRKSRRPVCMLLAFATIIVAMVVIIKIVLPQLILCVGLIVEEVPKTVEKVYVWLMEKEDLKIFISQTMNQSDFDWKAIVSNLGNMLISGAGGVMNAMVTMVSVTFSMIVQIVLALIFAIYLLLGKEKLAGQIKKTAYVYVKENVRHKISYVFATANNTFRSFVVGQCMEAVVIGVLCAIGMTILRLPYAAMTGTVIGLTALIPVMGAYIGAAIGAFMICTVSPMQAVIFLIYLVILQQLEGNLIYPRVVGSSIGLPAIWVVLAVTGCGGIWGIPGMLFGVPVVATLYKLLKADVSQKYEKIKEKEAGLEKESESPDEKEE